MPELQSFTDFDHCHVFHHHQDVNASRVFVELSFSLSELHRRLKIRIIIKCHLQWHTLAAGLLSASDCLAGAF